MTRVCCFCETWGFGGIEAFLINIFEKINRQDMEIDVVAARLDSDANLESLREMGIGFYQLTGSTRRILSNGRAFRRLQRERGYDVVHFNIYHALSLSYIKMAEKYGIPKRIAHSHNSGLRPGAARWLKLGIHRLSSRLWSSSATDWWTCSNNAANFMFPSTIAAHARLIPNGIPVACYAYDHEMRNGIRRQLGMPDSFIIGQVGRLCAQKNQRFTLKIFYRVFQYCPEARMILVGVGEDRGILERQAAELGIAEAVTFYGFTKSVHALMQAMDILILPSLFEGLGIVAIEAQAAGLPLICSTEVPLEANVTGRIKYLSLDEGEEAWAEHILAAMGNVRQDDSAMVAGAGYDSSVIAERVRSRYIEKTDFCHSACI